jgi:hypothetical protein
MMILLLASLSLVLCPSDSLLDVGQGHVTETKRKREQRDGAARRRCEGMSMTARSYLPANFSTDDTMTSIASVRISSFMSVCCLANT